MGAILLKLGFAGLRARLVPVLLTVVLVAAAAATATVALQIDRVADDPWQRTFTATNGAHVIAAGEPAALERVAALPGVGESTRPTGVVVTTLATSGRSYGLRAIGAGSTRPAIERPALTDGRWLERDGEVVLERSYARTLGLEPGETVSAAASGGSQRLAVVGLSVRAGDEPYPDSQPGSGFVTPATLEAIQPDAGLRGSVVAMRLTDPQASAAFIRRAQEAVGPGVRLEDWQDRRAQATERNEIGIVLSAYAVMVLVAVGLMVATFVGARVAQQRRELALLKAEGLTPRQLVAIALVENLAVGLAGAVLGVLIGVAVAPSLIRRSDDLIGGVPTTFDPLTALAVIVAVEALIALVTIIPARRVGRAATMRVLAGGEAPSRVRLVRLGRIVPLSVGLKQALSRPWRTIAVAVALTLSVASFVAVLGMEATLAREDVLEAVEDRAAVLPADPAGLAPTRLDPVDVPDLGREQIRPIVWGLNTLLMAVIVANLLATAILFVRERTRETGVLRALGFTPRQVLAGLLGSQTAIAVLAAAVGIPLGLAMFGGLYQLAGGEREFLTMPPAWQLLLVPIATAAAVALVALLPARHAAGLTITDALRDG